MGHIVRTPEGSYRANWRDESGRQKAKSFRTRKEAAGFMAQVEARFTMASTSTRTPDDRVSARMRNGG